MGKRFVLEDGRKILDPKIGRNLNCGGSNVYDDVCKKLKANEILVGVYDQVVHNLVILISCEEQFDGYYNSYLEGFAVGIDYYAVAKDRVFSLSD